MEFLQSLLSSWPVFVQGLGVTLALTVLTLIFSLLLAVLITAMRLSGKKPLVWFATAYLAIIRGVPLIALLFVIYFGIVSVVKVEAFTAAVVGLSIHTSAYVSEILRSGLASVPNGQVEAARSLGMSRMRTLQKVVGPQAIRVVVPALANQAIISLKDSSVAAFITVGELFMTAQRLSAASFEPLTYYSIVSLYYLAIVGLMTLGVNRVEAYFRKRG